MQMNPCGPSWSRSGIINDKDGAPTQEETLENNGNLRIGPEPSDGGENKSDISERGEASAREGGRKYADSPRINNPECDTHTCRW